MKFGALVARLKAAVGPMTAADNPGLTSSGGWGGWLGLIKEPFAGAWQSGITIDGPRQVVAFSAVFACVTGIAGDFGKLACRLMQLNDATNIGTPVGRDSPYWRVLRKPNHYQTRVQFFVQWIVCKLLHGNAYALKERDARGIVTSLYLLAPSRVKVLVANNGDVYYELTTDALSTVTENVIVPASEIIHDRMVTLFHPLIGVSPIFACALSATQGNRIQANSANFFTNQSRPSGMLLAPGRIDESDATRLKTQWETNFSGGNIGRVAVLGSNMKYEAMTIPAVEAQLIEQLKWTTEDVARCFHYPIFKLGGALPPGSTVDALQQVYYTDCLQVLIESAELCIDVGLGLPNGYYTEFDLDNLLRMDAVAKSTVLGNLVQRGIMSPNEARGHYDLPPVEGGEAPYLQMQNWQLAQLARREPPKDAPVTPPTDATTPEPPDDDALKDKAIGGDLDGDLLDAWASAELRKLLRPVTNNGAVEIVK